MPRYRVGMSRHRPLGPVGLHLVSAVLGTMLLAGGCARTSVEIGVTTRAHTYEGFGDPMELATADPRRMAVIPAVSLGAGGERTDAANMSMSEALDYDYRPFTLLGSESKPELTAMRFDEVVNTCIAAGRIDTLRTVTSSLRQTGIPDREAARSLGTALGVDYLLTPKLVSIKVDNAGRFTFTGLTFIRTGWISIEATLQLWDVPTGELVWQSTGEGSLTAENVVGISPPVQSALDGIMITLMGDFLTGRSQAVVRTTVENNVNTASPGTTTTTTTEAPVAPQAPSDPNPSEAPVSTGSPAGSNES